MALYVYQKYNAQLNNGSYFLSQTGQSNSANATALGWTDYSFNSTTGVISTAGTFIDTSNGSVYNVNNNVLTQSTVSGGSTTLTTFQSFYSGDYYSQGTLIGQVIAEDGTYPANGRHTDGFWYVKRVVATPPIVTSPNGGETFNATETITWTTPRTGLKYKVEISKNNGSTWATILTQSAVDATSFTKDFTNDSESSLTRIRVTGIDGSLFTASDESDGVFSILHNVAPTIPTSLVPSSTVIDRLKTNQFTWSHNDQNVGDAQSKVDLRWRPQGSPTWTNITSTGAEQAYYFASNTFALGQVEWQVRTYDQSGLVSPWSNTAVFTASEATNAPVIVQPGDIVGVVRPIIEWTGGTQLTYQIVVEDAINTVVWDTGEVTSAIKARTAGIDFINGATYKIKVRVKDGGGLFSSFTEKTVTVAYTPPAKPILEALKSDGSIRLVISNPAPTGTQPNISGNDVFKVIDGQWVRIASNVNATYTDYAVANNTEYTYFVVALGDTDTYSYSDEVAQTVTLKGAYIHDPLDAETSVYHFEYNGTGAESEYTPETAVLKFAGRRRPVVQYGSYADFAINVTLQASRDTTPMLKLREFVANRTPIVYRDDNGHFLYGVIQTLPITQEYAVSTANITITEIDYDVEV